MAKVVVILYEGTPREKRLLFPVLLFKKGELISVAKFKIQ